MTETPTPGTSRRWRRLSLVLALLAGFAAGVLATSILDHRRGPRFRGPEAAESRRGPGEEGRRRIRGGAPSEARIQRFRAHLESALELDESQRARLGDFLDRNNAEASAFWRATHERYRELRLRFRGQIREMLDDEQRATFDELFPESGGDAHDEEADGRGSPRSGAAFAPRHGDFR